MPGFYRIITPSAAVPTPPIDVPIDKPPKLDVLQKAVGGYIETVPFFDRLPDDPKQRCVAFCDEEGKLSGKPMNIRATEMWMSILLEYGHIGTPAEMNDVLVGSIIILWGDEAFMDAL